MFEGHEELIQGPTGPLRADALEILAAGIGAVDPYRSIMDFVSVEGSTLTVAGTRYDLEKVERVLVLGAGKAAIAMVSAINDLVGDRAEGHVNAIEDRTIGNVTCSRATHPIPGPEGVEGSRRIIELARSASGNDLVLCLISGGGSALMPLPEEGLTLGDKMEMTNILLKCGATIQELNCIRKHMSAIKGGKLAQAAAPATLVSLILSDVIGDPLDSIASGPTAPDPTTYGDARAILESYGVWEEAPEAVRRELREGKFETPMEGDPIFDRVQNVLIGNNKKAQGAMVHRARELGYQTSQLDDYVLGDARVSALELLETARSITGGETRAAIVAGGETTVIVQGSGRGGRNQEMALVNLATIEEGELFASVGTDGIDGKSHGAGAIADTPIRQNASSMGLDAMAFLANNDSTAFFEQAGGLLVTGPTGTNVADVELYLVHRTD
jgi:glycerate-2-kinase